MTTTPECRFRSLVASAWVLASVLLCSCRPMEVVSQVEHWEHSHHAVSDFGTPTVEALAHDLDKLQANIEKYGSVVAKHPDVWGQARLTKHREEFEQQMSAQLGAFEYTLQGTVSASDQAYFADALALSAAASGSSRAGRGATASASSSSSSTGESAEPSTDTTLPLPALEDKAFAAFSDIKRTGLRSPLALEFAGANTGIKVEPTVLLDQRARFINHLQELRRINEGDDTSDSPGYALNLVRIPVSVLPGKCTDIGYGAEVSLTMTPYLGEELLPTTFRSLVINDLVDQIGFPVTQFINNPENSVYFDEQASEDVREFIDYLASTSRDGLLINLKLLGEFRSEPGLQCLFTRPEWAWVNRLFPPKNRLEGLGTGVPKSAYSVAEVENARRYVSDMRASGRVEGLLRKMNPNIQVSISATKSRRARMPFPPSEMFDVYGFDFHRLVLDAHRALAKERFVRPCPDSRRVWFHLPDVQGYLQEEVAAAYEFLANPCNGDLWNQFCTGELADAVRACRRDWLEAKRLEFKCAVESNAPTSSPTRTALAWALIVESALLTDRLVEDMKESAAAKGCCLCTEWMPYFLPSPPPEARQAFNDYVRCRWPIHVFALDPAAQQQNLADTFSSRREMQLAMSMAFVSGRLSANNMMRYARRIEYDFATVDLNGTVIGFSHGDDTFGWRFYPRFQTPDIESNSTVFFRDLLIGGPNRNALLNQRRLEPGVRECYAVVIMPSFVPYATLDVTANWFKLTNPKAKELDSTDAVRLSRLVKHIDCYGPRVRDAGRYRDGELDRLIRKAKQLESRLPLQSTMVQIPYENTLGGFAMFSTGVTDLAPELTGWYGAESIDPSAEATIFLVGNHFSVHQTRVIAGGQQVAGVEMLSRQVMKVTIPQGVSLVGDKENKETFVDVQLATPYGVTQHLLIPVCTDAGAGPSGSGPAWASTTFELGFVYSGVSIGPAPSEPKFRPKDMLIRKGKIDASTFDRVDVTLTLDKRSGGGKANVSGLFNPEKDGYLVKGEDLSDAIFKAAALGPESLTPPTSSTATATLKFKSSKHLAEDQPAKMSNTLTINWIRAGTGK